MSAIAHKYINLVKRGNHRLHRSCWCAAAMHVSCGCQINMELSDGSAQKDSPAVSVK